MHKFRVWLAKQLFKLAFVIFKFSRWLGRKAAQLAAYPHQA